MESSLENDDTVADSPFAIRESRVFTLTCMKGYSEAAVAKMLEAEALLTRGIELRDEAKLLFARANELAMRYALQVGKAKSVSVQAPDQYEDVLW